MAVGVTTVWGSRRPPLPLTDELPVRALPALPGIFAGEGVARGCAAVWSEVHVCFGGKLGETAEIQPTSPQSMLHRNLRDAGDARVVSEQERRAADEGAGGRERKERRGEGLRWQLAR